MNQSQVGDEARSWVLVAYALAPLGSLLALILAADDPALKRHAVQALLAGSVAMVMTIALGLIPALSCAATPLAVAFWLYLVVCGVRAYRGQARLPGSGGGGPHRLPLCGVGCPGAPGRGGTWQSSLTQHQKENLNRR